MNASLSRRSFLRASGVSLALPVLDSLLPRYARAASGASPQRMVCICTTLGIHAENIIPPQAGRDYTLTPYLEPLGALRDQFTIFSGISHPEVDGGHSSEASFLTGQPHPGNTSFQNSISLDQFALEKLPPATRFDSLVLTTGGGGGMSVTRAGSKIPADWKPSEVFKRLFVNGSTSEVVEQTRRLREGQSILDLVAGDAKRLQARASAPDRAKLDDYFTNVREVERRLHEAEAWQNKPKPHVDVPPPVDVPNHADFVNRTRLMFDLIQLALQTDSTRIVTLEIAGHNLVPPVNGVTMDWHNCSHHGMNPDRLAQLRLIEMEQMKLFGSFLDKLNATQENSGSVLNATSVLYGSNLGNANNHDTRNLPILLAGGGFKHGTHVAGNPDRNTPLCNVFVAMLQKLGVPTDKFASNSGVWSPA